MRVNRTAIKSIALFNRIVEELRFFSRTFGHCLGTAVLLNPLQYQVDAPNRKDWRCIVKGIFLGMSLIAQISSQIGGRIFPNIIPDDYNGGSGGTEIFLSSRINHGKFLHRYRSAENIAGHVGYQRGI